jgi:hypothetical protein
MVTFKVRVFEQDGSWFFRWDNVNVSTVCKVSAPLKSKDEAEVEKQRFMDAEKKKRPWVVFESE